MNSLVIYYSHYGNTSSVTYQLLKALTVRGEAKIVRLEYSNGRRNPLTRLIYKILPLTVELAPVETDLSKYDVVCLGIPVLSGTPSSAITKYISLCTNIGKKKIICCYVYGFEANAKRCAQFVRKLLNKKGNPYIIEMFMPWNQVHNNEVLDEAIEEAIGKATAPLP